MMKNGLLLTSLTALTLVACEDDDASSRTSQAGAVAVEQADDGDSASNAAEEDDDSSQQTGDRGGTSSISDDDGSSRKTDEDGGGGGATESARDGSVLTNPDKDSGSDSSAASVLDNRGAPRDAGTLGPLDAQANQSLDGGSAPDPGAPPIASDLPDAGEVGVADADAGDADSPSADSHVGGDDCDPAASAATLVGAIDAVSTGEIFSISEENGVHTLYVDASAGGFMLASQSPWIYINLSTRTRVNVSDFEAFTSNDWHLALKRTGVRINSADSGPGTTELATITAPFSDVTADAVAGAAFSTDEFVSETCQLSAEEVSPGNLAPITAIGGWFDYNPVARSLTPKRGQSYLIRDNGTVYKLGIDSYNSNPDGTAGLTTGRYLLRIQEIEQ